MLAKNAGAVSATSPIRACISLAIFWFFIHKVNEGRNWARLSLTAWTVIGLLFLVVGLFVMLQDPGTMKNLLLISPVWLLIDLLVGIGGESIKIYALVLLFQKSSSDWFRKMKSMPEVKEEIIHEPRVF